MYPMALEEAARAIGLCLDAPGTVKEISTDTRTLSEGCLFIALEGARFDGHDYVESALQQGAFWAVVRRDFQPPKGVSEERLLRVKDTLQALLDIGGFYRSQFRLPCVGVTGSVGKTTTKDMIASALCSGLCTLKTEGNLNNEIGLPKTLLGLTDRHEAAVIEMGMQGMGEIARLCRCARPTLGVITNIGVSHIERLGSRENILKAKLELAQALPRGAPLFLCGDDDMLSAVQIPRLQICTYGVENPSCDWIAQEIREDSAGCVFTAVYNEKAAGKIRKQHPVPVALPCVGLHNVKNALAALAVGQALGLAPQRCAQALKAYTPSGMRQKLVSWKGHTVAEDCYNASPDSMRAALETLASLPCKGKRIAVLGDMLELGASSPGFHKEIGALAAQKHIDVLLAYGPLAQGYCEGARQGDHKIPARHYSSIEALLEALKKELSQAPESVVWVKGSHGMRLETLLEKLYAA